MNRSLILQIGVRAVYPMMLLFAAWLFLKGHNSPGGGFIAGLLTAAAIVIRLIAFGHEKDSGSGNIYVMLVGIGLVVALVTAATPMFLGAAFFTHTFGHVDLPLFGHVELATAALFDLGVYIVVVGNVGTVITAMTRSS